MSEIDPELLKQLQEAFVIEAREQLQTIMNNVINLESSTDDASKSTMSEAILHELHSLKGNSRAAGILTAETICQSFESAILSLRRKKQLLHAEAADVFHLAIDLLDQLINRVEAGEADYDPGETLVALLQKLKILDERQKAPEATTIEATDNNVSIETSAPSMQNLKPEQSSEKLSQGSSGAPAGDKSASTRIALWKLDKLLRESEEMLILKQISEQHLDDIRDLKAYSKILSSESRRLTQFFKGSPNDYISSSAERELLAFSDSLSKFSSELEQTITAKLRRQQTEQRLCFNMVDGFVDSVKSLLMQDFSSLLSMVPKLTRDLSRELKKEVDLEIFGTEIEIDRRILEEIKDPVIHLVRNSLDHGIESAEERLAQGKPAKASLKIGARQDESGHVELIISDDGKGINADKLKAAALKEGAITADEASRMSAQDAIELMYRSCVSTSDTVNEISGRGLGMPIVRERIHDLGGRVLVDTSVGKGTTFTLKLPTKLSTFRGIQVISGKLSFIIPTLHVHYAGRVLRSDIKQSGGKNVVTINGQLTSVQTLSDVLNIDANQTRKYNPLHQYQQILVLESGEKRAGFLVDEILHEHEVLVRGLSYPLVRVANIAGATILGSGQVVPVLNIADLLESSIKASWADEELGRQLEHDLVRSQKMSEMPIFLVDQHKTSLVMLKGFLESEGYIVQTFDSNESALEGLDFDVPLILLKNSELPETQESGLAYWIRKDLRLRDLPILFFGSHSEEEGKEFSSQAGGNGYFSRVDIDRRQVLDLIERLT